MDIFKLFYEHDLWLDKTKERTTDREPNTDLPLEEFMKPIPTYSKFYLTGTRIDNETFGLSVLEKYNLVLEMIDQALDDYFYHCGSRTEQALSSLVPDAEIGVPIFISRQYSLDVDSGRLELSDDSNIGQIKDELREILERDILLIYKEKAHDGYDLHLFSKENIYEDLFYPLRELVGDRFRFFSINSKRVQSERKFYFETWTLDKPPHGAEEVFPETML